jgi:Ribose/Galactose Isomerase
MAANNTARSPLRIVVGSDNAGHAYKTAVKAELENNPGVSEVLDVGVVDADDSTAYPHIAVEAGKKIIAGDVWLFPSCLRILGVLIFWGLSGRQSPPHLWHRPWSLDCGQQGPWHSSGHCTRSI